MLPFDNKNEFQVVIDMPGRNHLGRTAIVAKEIAQYIATVRRWWIIKIMWAPLPHHL